MLSTLWLYPELNCSSCVDDADDQSGPGLQSRLSLSAMPLTSGD